MTIKNLRIEGGTVATCEVCGKKPVLTKNEICYSCFASLLLEISCEREGIQMLDLRHMTDAGVRGVNQAIAMAWIEIQEESDG